MPNYDYANTAGLTALSERTFEKIKSKITTDVVTSEAANPLVIETAAAQTAKSTIVNIEPIQDLHGQSNPYPAGGGKNLLNTSAFTEGTYKGITIKIQNDGSLLCNGTANEPGGVVLGSAVLASGTYAFTGTTSGSTDGTFYLNFSGLVNVSTNERTYTVSGTAETVCTLQLTSGYQMNNVVIKPMIRLASDADATFAPYSNICPISGLDEVTVERTGFNQWDEEWELGTYDGITGAKVNDSTKIRSKNYIPVIPETNYYFFEDVNPAYHNLHFYDADKNFLSVNTRDVASFTTPSNAYYITFTLHSTYGTTYSHDICINISDPAKNGTYEPYQKFDAEVDLPTTIYGGTLNLETGELVCDYGMVDLGTLTWGTTSANRWYCSTFAQNHNAKIEDADVAANMISDKYKAFANNYLYSYSNVIGMALHPNGDLMIRNKDTASPTGQIAYELATPITYHLTPAQLDLLKGTNVLTVNGKTIQVTYREGSLATLEELNVISFDLSNVKSKLPPIIIKNGMLQVTYDDGQ